MTSDNAIETAVIPWCIRLIQIHDKFMAYPLVKTWQDVVLFLITISGAFWLISKVLGLAALITHPLLDRALEDLFIVAYNLVLAVLFSSVLVHGIIVERAGKDDFFYCQAAGFILVYLVLGAAYSERSGEIGEFAIPGYIAGLGAYLFFCLRTQYLLNPATTTAYKGVVWLTNGWPKRLVIAYTVTQALVYIGRAIKRQLSRRTL